jgi:hypothetical protein
MPSAKRRKPQEGDVVRIPIGPSQWLFGRVVSLQANSSPFDDECGDCILLYVFRHISSNGVPPRPLLAADLLFPPVISIDEPWRMRWFEFVENRPFEPGEVLAQHCFKSFIWTPARYFDERGRRLTERSEPCGDQGLISDYGIQLAIQEALPKGVEFNPPGMPGAARDNSASEESEIDDGYDDDDNRWCITINVPEWMGLDGYHYEFEDALTNAVEKTKAGEWVGHGFDLADGVFEIDFYGESVERIVEVITPVLRKWKDRLPRGWNVTKQRGSGPVKVVSIDL